MATQFRIKTQEKDFSGFVLPIVSETGAMVIDSEMGPSTPVLCQSESDVILYFGIPNSTKWGAFEAVSFARQAPVWLSRAIGEDALYAGIDVLRTTVESFGTRTGRDIDFFNPASVSTNKVENIGTGDGITLLYTGTLLKFPITGNSYKLYTGTDLRNSAESGGTISGTDANGTLNLADGDYSITFTGTPGTAAKFDSSIDLSSGVDLSSGGKPKAVKLTIDQTAYDNLSFGSSATTTRSSIITAINTAVGYTAATTLGSNFIRITGRYGSSTLGQIKIEAPSNTTTYDSAVNLIFATSPSSLTQTIGATDPVGAVPLAGQSITVDYIYTQNISTTLSHSFFAFSQYDDSHYQLAGSVSYVSGQKYTLTLYTKVPNKGYALINTYDYSLIREKDNFGRSLYYADVFKDNPYIKIFVNSLYSGVPAQPSIYSGIVDFTGGNKGDDPVNSDFVESWNQFQRPNKYAAKIFMDIYSGYANTLQNIVQNYQPYSMFITMVPPGNNAAGAVIYRQSLGIDYDHGAIYTNWATVVDSYNNSFAFISQIGAVGAKWAQMQNVFDGVAPAGIDENGHGGQLNTGFQVTDIEYDYSETDKQTLDLAQINPIELSPIYGPILDGNKTLQVSLSDTSFIHTRRIYNFILDNVVNQVLRQQVFKFNDDLHQIQVKTKTEAIVDPLVAQNLLVQATVVCDNTNNTNAVKNQRKFVVDIYVIAQPDSEEVILTLVRLPQGGVVASFTPA